MQQAQQLQPDDNSMLSFDLDPELWLEDPEDEEQEPDEPSAPAAASPPPVRHFANIGHLPAPDDIPLPRCTAAKAVDRADRDGKLLSGVLSQHDGFASRCLQRQLGMTPVGCQIGIPHSKYCCNGLSHVNKP